MLGLILIHVSKTGMMYLQMSCCELNKLQGARLVGPVLDAVDIPQFTVGRN